MSKHEERKQAIRKAIRTLDEHYLGELTRVNWRSGTFTTRAGDGSKHVYWFIVIDNQLTIQTQTYGLTAIATVSA